MLVLQKRCSKNNDSYQRFGDLPSKMKIEKIGDHEEAK